MLKFSPHPTVIIEFDYKELIQYNLLRSILNHESHVLTAKSRLIGFDSPETPIRENKREREWEKK